jgi:hypothetical protein
MLEMESLGHPNPTFEVLRVLKSAQLVALVLIDTVMLFWGLIIA